MKLFDNIKDKKEKIGIVGLGYVGLPLAIEFGKIVNTIGFDVKKKRIAELKDGIDVTHEISKEEITASGCIEFTDNPSKLREAKFIIIAVPTPINKNKQPDLACMIGASTIVGQNLTAGSIAVYESTVYPGVTEDICIPVLEKESGLRCGVDFKVGYSPERINPGDKEHNISDIIKVVSGQDAETLEVVASVYELIVKAGVFRAASIKTAEAAKVIENTQRDLNIALMNELSMIFGKMNIDTSSVLAAAGTKWNFIKMQPGLVGGHCIGVDPYYLTHKAEEIGYTPQVILAGRRINDNMGKYIAEQTIKKLIAADKTIKGAKVRVMGITFKEDVCDIRNSKVVDIINELHEYGVDVLVSDPLADKNEVYEEYGVHLKEYDPNMLVDGIVIAVKHLVFKDILSKKQILKHLNGGNGKGVLIDVKGTFNPDDFKGTNVFYWRL
ncbi:MAG: nucleotide sugar dehydrogenase [bacterium]